MSEKLSIQEAGKSRNFSGVGVIETETPEGDSCFWVPKSERELETGYVIKNGTYRPQKYGFSDIHVNVFDLTTDLDGNDWKIDIGDIELPDISLPDFDIDLTIGSDGMPNIEFDIHIITVDDDEIKVVLPGGEEIVIHGPSLTDPVVILDAIEISYDPSTGEWTVTALVECTVGDTTYNPGDVIKTWPGTEKVDFHIQVGIALPDLSETIDLDAGFDVSLDVGDMSIDISGIDLDGLDINISIDLDTLEVEEEYLPTSIKIITQPNKLEYKDGEPIDLTGMVVSAYYNDGTAVWANEDYPNGIIPLGELIVDPEICIFDNNIECVLTSEFQDVFEAFGEKLPVTSKTHYTRDYMGNGGENGSYRKYTVNIHSKRQTIKKTDRLLLIEDDNGQDYVVVATQTQSTNFTPGSMVQVEDSKDIVLVWNNNYSGRSKKSRYGEGPFSYAVSRVSIWPGYGTHIYRYQNKIVQYLYDETPTVWAGGEGNFDPADVAFPPGINDWYSINNTEPSVKQKKGSTFSRGKLAWLMVYGNRDNENVITISWARPKDGKILSALLYVPVEESDNIIDGAGHYGGTTISGDHGGSHHSGKF